MKEITRYWLHSIEFDINSKCNLNCAYCAHFSNLNSEKEDLIYPLDQLENDMKRLSELFIISTIKIVGGEPFLVDNLIDYVRVIVKYFPYSWVKVYTNNILKTKINNFILDCNSDEKLKNVDVNLSHYPIIKLGELSERHKIMEKPKFKFLNLNLKGDSDAHISRSKCFCYSCLSLRQGRIYICPITANLKHFLDYFNLNNSKMSLDLNEASIDIYNNDSQTILNFINGFDGGLKFCRYCQPSHPLVESKQSEKTIEEYVDKDYEKRFKNK